MSRQKSHLALTKSSYDRYLSAGIRILSGDHISRILTQTLSTFNIDSGEVRKHENIFYVLMWLVIELELIRKHVWAGILFNTLALIPSKYIE